MPALVCPSDRCRAAATRPVPQAAHCGALRSSQPGDSGAAGDLYAAQDPVCGEGAVLRHLRTCTAPQGTASSGSVIRMYTSHTHSAVSHAVDNIQQCDSGAAEHVTPLIVQRCCLVCQGPDHWTTDAAPMPAAAVFVASCHGHHTTSCDIRYCQPASWQQRADCRHCGVLSDHDQHAA